MTLAEEFKKLYKAKTDLYNYWKLLAVDEGMMKYSEAEHIKILADYAQRFTEGKIKRLMVIMPPRHGKSTMMSHFMPAWYISNNPEKSLVLLSYGKDFASEQGAKCRVLFDHPEHKRIFSNQKFEVDRYGEFSIGKSDGSMNFASGGPGTPLTGRGADLIVIDDPIKDDMEAQSVAHKTALLEWYRKVVVTRLVPGGGICLCMTRWAYDDLAGTLLEQNPDEWEVLHMPAIDKDGNPLWPGRYGIDELMAIREEIGERAFSAMYQGEPASDEGAFFRRDWFNLIQRVPSDWKETSAIRFWDLAASKKANGDFLSGTLMSLYHNGNVVIKDIFHKQVTPFEAMESIKNLAEEDEVPIGIEQEGGAAAGMLLKTLQDDLRMYGVRTIKPKAGETKPRRANPLAIAAENGAVYMLPGKWNEPFIKELMEFPLGKNDDMVDSTSYAFLMLSGKPRRRNRAWLV